MSKKSKKHKVIIRASASNSSTDFYPAPGGPIGARKPRRNYWGNIHDEDTYQENRIRNMNINYDYSDFDAEDDHDSYYNEDSYD